MSKLIEYMEIHLISLWQDLDKLGEELEDLDPGSNDYLDLDSEYDGVVGQIMATRHLLDYAKLLDSNVGSMLG